MIESERGTVPDCSCKVGTIATDFDLDDIHEELRRKWSGEGDMSVRNLTDLFNRRVLQAGFKQAGKLPIDGEIENVYRVLTADDVDEGSRTRAREQLRQDGVPIEELEERMISHQTLYRHLSNCLDLTYETSEKTDSQRINQWRSRLLSLQSRTAAVTEHGIEQLRSNESVDIGSFDVLIDINVLCNDCNDFFTLEEFLDEQRCSCNAPDNETT